MKKLTKDRSGISPVVTTVVLVAIGIVIAVAVSLWLSGLASTFTRFEKLEIISAYAVAERPLITPISPPSATLIRALSKPTVTFLGSLAGYKYRRPITIDNTKNPNSLTNYQVSFTLDTASLISQGKMRSDCGDLRFTDSDGSTLLSYWIESGINTPSTRIWIKVPSIPASSTKTIYVYYGNPSAVSQSNGKSTFIMYDDFSDLSQWSIAKGSSCKELNIDTTTFGYSVLKITVSSGTASSSTWGIVYNTAIQLPPSFKIDIDVYTNNIADTLPYFNAVNGPFYVMRFDARNNYYDLIGYYALGATTTTVLARATKTSANTWFHQQVIRYSSGKWELRKGGDLATLGTLETSYTHTMTTSGGFGLSGDGGTGVTYFKNLRIRQYTSPEPATSVGNEQTEPSAPQNLNTVAGDMKITLIWQPPSNNGGSAITNYKIYKGTSSGGESYLTTVGNVTSYEDTYVTNGITYYYKVSAVNSMGEGALSNEVSAVPATTPGAPQNLKAILSNGKIVLQWDPPFDNGGSPVIGYKIYRGTTPGDETYLTTVGNVTSYEDGSIANGVTYYYKVSAINGVGESPTSSEVSILSTPPGTVWRVYIVVKNTGSADAIITMIMINGVPTTDATLANGITSWNIEVDTNDFSSATDPATTPVPIPVGATATFQFKLLQNTKISNGQATSGITLNIVLHSAAGKDYPASVTLP